MPICSASDPVAILAHLASAALDKRAHPGIGHLEHPVGLVGELGMGGPICSGRTVQPFQLIALRQMHKQLK
jgi:hypothetical protein